jgi:hypothetical protein
MMYIQDPFFRHDGANQGPKAAGQGAFSEVFHASILPQSEEMADFSMSLGILLEQ